MSVFAPNFRNQRLFQDNNRCDFLNDFVDKFDFRLFESHFFLVGSNLNWVSDHSDVSLLLVTVGVSDLMSVGMTTVGVSDLVDVGWGNVGVGLDDGGLWVSVGDSSDFSFDSSDFSLDTSDFSFDTSDFALTNSVRLTDLRVSVGDSSDFAFDTSDFAFDSSDFAFNSSNSSVRDTNWGNFVCMFNVGVSFKRDVFSSDFWVSSDDLDNFRLLAFMDDSWLSSFDSRVDDWALVVMFVMDDVGVVTVVNIVIVVLDNMSLSHWRWLSWSWGVDFDDFLDVSWVSHHILSSFEVVADFLV